MSDECKLRRRLATVALATVWVTYATYAWLTVGSQRQKFADLRFRDCFTPGLVQAVESIHAHGSPRAFGPHHDVSPYVFHRLNEMLYPVPYYAPMLPDQLKAGDVYVLLPGQALPVVSKVLCSSGLFRVMEVSP